MVVSEKSQEIVNNFCKFIETNNSLLIEKYSLELIAVRELKKEKFLAVIYRELNHDGFIITAFLTKRIKSLSRRKQIWSNSQ